MKQRAGIDADDDLRRLDIGVDGRLDVRLVVPLRAEHVLDAPDVVVHSPAQRRIRGRRPVLLGHQRRTLLDQPARRPRQIALEPHLVGDRIGHRCLDHAKLTVAAFFLPEQRAVDRFAARKDDDDKTRDEQARRRFRCAPPRLRVSGVRLDGTGEVPKNGRMPAPNVFTRRLRASEIPAWHCSRARQRVERGQPPVRPSMSLTAAGAENTQTGHCERGAR